MKNVTNLLKVHGMGWHSLLGDIVWFVLSIGIPFSYTFASP